jgi:hypothetical protein
MRAIQRITQADVITMDVTGRLWMWEIKTGGTRMLNRAQGLMLASSKYANMPCTTGARYELQRHYTHEALVAEGVPLYASRVLIVRKSRNKLECKELQNAKWL